MKNSFTFHFRKSKSIQMINECFTEMILKMIEAKYQKTLRYDRSEGIEQS